MKSDDPQFGPGQIERAVSSNCFRQPTRSSRLGTDRYYSTKVRLVKPPVGVKQTPGIDLPHCATGEWDRFE